MTVKPLGRKAYGSIPHLPGSRRGPGDHGCNEGILRILTQTARDTHDEIIVTEKIDGSNVAVARVGGELIPLGRSGQRASESRYEQIRQFASWAMSASPYSCFDHLLTEGEWISGEWLGMAHGTRYDLAGRAPFAAFDIFRGLDKFGGGARVPYAELCDRCAEAGISTAPLLHRGGPIPIAEVGHILGMHGHYGAIDTAEGHVWRLEREGAFEYLAKYVRPSKIDGLYLPSESGLPPVWNWEPGRP